MAVSKPDGESVRQSDDRIDQVIAALKGLRFGQVTVVVQDGVIVRIDRTERRRLER